MKTATARHDGYAGTTARAIASVGRFAPGVTYYYFSDLDDLLVDAASPSGGQRLRRSREAIRAWEGGVWRDLLRGLPFAALTSPSAPTLASTIFHLGARTLSHVDGDERRIDPLFSQANRLARVLDRVPRLYLRQT